MALADVLRQRVSRRGRTAQVECGELGTVTVEALPPRECAALGMKDGGRALLYAACRELQAAGETLRRERRLFTPDEVTQYVSDGEARTAARTVLALSGVTHTEAESQEQSDDDAEAVIPDVPAEALPSASSTPVVSGADALVKGTAPEASKSPESGQIFPRKTEAPLPAQHMDAPASRQAAPGEVPAMGNTPASSESEIPWRMPPPMPAEDWHEDAVVDAEPSIFPESKRALPEAAGAAPKQVHLKAAPQAPQASAAFSLPAQEVFSEEPLPVSQAGYRKAELAEEAVPAEKPDLPESTQRIFLSGGQIQEETIPLPEQALSGDFSPEVDEVRQYTPDAVSIVRAEPAGEAAPHPKASEAEPDFTWGAAGQPPNTSDVGKMKSPEPPEPKFPELFSPGEDGTKELFPESEAAAVTPETAEKLAAYLLEGLRRAAAAR